ncbi:MAG: hypothetical protein AAGD07_06400 [Planctomycetota bacterium]
MPANSFEMAAESAGHQSVAMALSQPWELVRHSRDASLEGAHRAVWQPAIMLERTRTQRETPDKSSSSNQVPAIKARSLVWNGQRLVPSPSDRTRTAPSQEEAYARLPQQRPAWRDQTFLCDCRCAKSRALTTRRAFVLRKDLYGF